MAAARIIVAIILTLLTAAPLPAAADGGRTNPIERELARIDDAVALGLNEEARRLCHNLLDRHPDNEAAMATLRGLSDDRTLPRDSAPYRLVREKLPARFAVRTSKRYVVFSDAPPSLVQKQLECLERTHHQFTRFTDRLGLEPRPLRHKLVCVLFKSREDYRAFARGEDGVEEDWIAGYYAPRSDRIVFYLGDDNPSVVAARQELEEIEESLSTISDSASRAARQGLSEAAQTLHRNAAERRVHIERERARVNAFADEVLTSTTVHEGTHQLLFHTGVQSPRVQYPVWISEGLASSFETTNVDEAFGPDRRRSSRQALFAQSLKNDELLPLRDLVTLKTVPPGRDMINRVYTQSEALVIWLFEHRRSALARYLRLLRLEPTGVVETNRAEEIFRAAMGDIEGLESTWIRQELDRLAEAGIDE